MWYLVQQISTGRVVRVTERAGVYPADLAQREARMVAQGRAEAAAIDAVRGAPSGRVRHVLRTRPTADLYEAEIMAVYDWEKVRYARKGRRTDGPVQERVRIVAMDA